MDKGIARSGEYREWSIVSQQLVQAGGFNDSRENGMISRFRNVLHDALLTIHHSPTDGSVGRFIDLLPRNGNVYSKHRYQGEPFHNVVRFCLYLSGSSPLFTSTIRSPWLALTVKTSPRNNPSRLPLRYTATALPFHGFTRSAPRFPCTESSMKLTA